MLCTGGHRLAVRAGAAMDRPDREPLARCMRLIYAHRSTPITHSFSFNQQDQARVRSRPDAGVSRRGGSQEAWIVLRRAGPTSRQREPGDDDDVGVIVGGSDDALARVR
jgi:hypothetical protein